MISRARRTGGIPQYCDAWARNGGCKDLEGIVSSKDKIESAAPCEGGSRDSSSIVTVELGKRLREARNGGFRNSKAVGYGIPRWRVASRNLAHATANGESPLFV